jgi:hypothetical protein
VKWGESLGTRELRDVPQFGERENALAFLFLAFLGLYQGIFDRVERVKSASQIGP